jgi:hypothetical protein
MLPDTFYAEEAERLLLDSSFDAWLKDKIHKYGLIARRRFETNPKGMRTEFWSMVDTIMHDLIDQGIIKSYDFDTRRTVIKFRTTFDDDVHNVQIVIFFPV